jgi:acyl-CoA reductase-like NAD-dependent aldehyde dehydrogenase
MELEVKTAFEQTVIDSIPMNTPADIEQMLVTADKVFKDKTQHIPIEKRCQILNHVAQQMKDNEDMLAMQIAKEGGKPLVDAKVEVARAIDGMQVCIEHVRTRHGQEVPMNLNAASTNRLAVTRFEPLGIVVAISAFNHPLNLIVHQVAPAIAAGCPVIIKPASTTPLSAKSFVEYLHQAGLDPRWCQLCIVGGKDAEKLATDNRVSFLSFIGSAEIGWQLRSKIAPGTRCALEHGGIAPVIIDESAKIAPLLPKLIKGAFYHAGQVCVSVQRVFVPKNQMDDISQNMMVGVNRLVTGDPTQMSTDVGPLILPAEVDRVESWINESIQQGAQCLTGGKRLSATTFEPTVLIDPPKDSKVMQHEVFGPAVVLIGYDEITDAIDMANDVPFSFQASIFSDNIYHALKSADAINAAAVMINDHTAFRVDWMPFAGLKQSGHGVGGIPHTMDEMSQQKMLVFNYD